MAAMRGQWLLRNPALTFGLRRTSREGIGLALEQDETWSGNLGAARVEIRCLSGTVWVTLEGDVEDHVLTAGETFVAAGPARLAMMALHAARVRVAACSGERQDGPRAEQGRSSAA